MRCTGTITQTDCEYCGAEVFLLQTDSGSVYYDECWGEWPTHSCSSSRRRFAPHGRHCGMTTKPTRCSSCGQSVYFLSCNCGSKVFVDELGQPWIIHGCYYKLAP